ncbi:578_t:CDS:1, partial [Gigaspora rosea]
SFEAVVAETMNEIASKHQISLSNSHHYIQKLREIHLGKEIPITVIISQSLLPLNQIQQALSITHTFIT